MLNVSMFHVSMMRNQYDAKNEIICQSTEMYMLSTFYFYSD